MKRKMLSIVLVLAVAVAFMPSLAFAGSSVSMTTFDQVYKDGNTVYCAGAGGVYKATVKKGKVKKVKRLCKAASPIFADEETTYTYISSMKKKGKYLYFLHGSEGTMYTICRVSINGGKVKYLESVGDQVYWGYVIKGKWIYYDYGDDGFHAKLKKMKLNGKSKKSTKVKPIMKSKNRNKAAKGYSVIMKYSKGYVKDYLKTPKGKYYLGKIRAGEY